MDLETMMRPTRWLAWPLLLPLVGPGAQGCGFDAFKDLLDTGSEAEADGDSGLLDDDDTDTGMTGGSGGGSGDGTGDGSDDGDDCVDNDADGVDTCSGDCDDSDASTWPGAAENDDPTACMRDADGDGWGDATAASPIIAGQDCDDTDPSLTPADGDGDGWSACDGDCDDGNASISPSATETPFDGTDSDCDGDDGGFTTSATGGGGASYPITDYATTTSTASISSCPSVYAITVTVDIEHTWRGDLRVVLTGPTGASATLHDRTGSWEADLVGSYGSSGGSLTPVDSLSLFVGTNGTGTWTLSVEDTAYGDSGQLDSWGLNLTCI